ncbi:MAG: serine hydrolase domain-containing protein [Verrucomicrobiia bacterium]|jgi:CubicO group peptidase (beta-lactamase class C family)
MRVNPKLLSFAAGVLIAVPTFAAETTPLKSKAHRKLDADIRTLIDKGALAGAQVAIRRQGDLILSRSYGTVAVESAHTVDEQTLFLIGSCSKTFASACVLNLIDDPKVPIELGHRIDRWLPAFANPSIRSGGKASRAPTVEELLSHRSGIYSQKLKMTPEQGRLIRTFDITLKQSVNDIASHSLIAQPGAMYAYSGAGYCVLGRVAELAGDHPFETMLQERLCRPLGLQRTTFFPAGKFPDNQFATGFLREAAPHLLGSNHRFPLIGGSLYSTAGEMTVFGEAVARQWRHPKANNPLGISSKTIRELTEPRDQKSAYSLGWRVSKRKGIAPVLSHSGALYGSRAWIAVDLESGASFAACWTLAKQNPEAPNVARIIMNALNAK